MISQSLNKPSWADYYEICKPKVVMLMILTVLVGMFLAVDGWVDLQVLILGNVGIGLVAAGGAAINHIVDAELDTNMARTKKRPMAQGRISFIHGAIFAATITSVGMVILMVFINALTAWLTLASLVGYAFIYTLFLKRATPQNIVIGGLAGAMPPLLGWTAVTNSIEPLALLLVLIIFTWTPPHFWALAIHRKDEYAKAGIPMLPVTHGVKYTSLHALLYTIIMVVVTILPYTVQSVGLLYLFGVTLLNIRFLQWAWRLYKNSHQHVAINTFKYSITYLMLLFIVLLVDHYFYFEVSFG